MKMDISDDEKQFYMQQLMDNYQNPQNFGILKDCTFSKSKKNVTCGDAFNLYVKLNDNNDTIENIKFSGEGCAISTASFSLLTQKIKGMKINEIKNFTDKDVYNLVGIKISPGRQNCALLSLHTLQEGITDFENHNK